MKDMMKEMMREMMGSMMKELMTEMMSEMMGTKPEVTPAEVVAPKPQAMSLEDFLALEPEAPAENVSRKTEKAPVDFVVESFVPRGGRKVRHGLAYNQFVSKSVWTYNHLMIRKNYPNVKYSNGHYYCDTTGDLQNFAGSYHIVDKLNDDQMKVVREYWDSKKK